MNEFIGVGDCSRNRIGQGSVYFSDEMFYASLPCASVRQEVVSHLTM